jgi:hypothetical protein
VRSATAFCFTRIQIADFGSLVYIVGHVCDGSSGRVERLKWLFPTVVPWSATLAHPVASGRLRTSLHKAAMKES